MWVSSSMHKKLKERVHHMYNKIKWQTLKYWELVNKKRCQHQFRGVFYPSLKFFYIILKLRIMLDLGLRAYLCWLLIISTAGEAILQEIYTLLEHSKLHKGKSLKQRIVVFEGKHVGECWVWSNITTYIYLSLKQRIIVFMRVNI